MPYLPHSPSHQNNKLIKAKHTKKPSSNMQGSEQCFRLHKIRNSKDKQLTIKTGASKPNVNGPDELVIVAQIIQK